MRACPIGFFTVALVLIGFVSCVTPRATDEEGIQITYKLADDFASGVTVHSIVATKSYRTVSFVFDITSDADRGMSFFNPPDGDTISIQQNFPAGRHAIEVSVPIRDLRVVENITVNFYIPAVELTGSVFLNSGEIGRLREQ